MFLKPSPTFKSHIFPYINTASCKFIYFTHEFLQLCSKLILVHFKCSKTGADLTFLEFQTS